MSLQTNIPTINNGNQMIAFMKGQDVGKYFNGGFDSASLNSWYQEDPLENHMGVMTMWNDQKREKSPASLLTDLVGERSVLEVNGFEGGFTYSVENKQKGGLFIEESSSHQTFAGVDNGIFYAVLNKELSPGTVIGYDDFDGIQAIVSDEEDVEPTGTGYRTPLQLTTQNKRASFPVEKLNRGVEFFVVSHGAPEYGTKFAKLDMPDTPGSMKFEFRLGSVTGVESFITAKAGSVTLKEGIATAGTKQYMDKIKGEMDAKGYGDVAVRMDVDPKSGKPIKDSANLGSTMELLTMKYLDKITSTKLLFQQSGEVRTTNGVLRFNDGLWRQAMRGRIIEYGREITKQHIRKAVEYIFSKSDLEFESRRIKFKCGTQAFYNVLEIFKEEVNLQIAQLSPLFNQDALLKKDVITGSDLLNLSMLPVRFTNVYLPMIGMVEIERDVNLDYGLRGDRFETGMHPDGAAHTTYSMIIWDASSQDFSNNATSNLPAGTNLAEGGNANSNIFLVKPEGPVMYSGRSTGRYDSRRSSDIMSAGKYMAEEYFAYNISDVFIKDPSKIVMIHKSPKFRRGFN
jgi:hypothetical protein